MHNVYKLHIKLGNLKALYFVFQTVLAVYWDNSAYLASETTLAQNSEANEWGERKKKLE